ncbi:DUF4142 domain-containing protein [Streptosporangium sp. NPDC000239]|uniref:DUF4142 domain-containing protein n=1 Tax=unclassified Streptosporangium TaxID=2632669 RepID=UPI003321D07E
MMRRIIVLLATVAVVLGGGATRVLAQPSLNEQDKTFLAQAHRSNLTEIEAGRLAEKKSSNQAVQNIAKKIVADHLKLDAAVKREAQRAGVTLPEQPAPKQRATLDKLSNLNGAAFNNAWIRAQIAGHRQTLTVINTELRDGSSAAVKKVASEAKPVVQAHLEMLQQARGNGGGGGGNGGGGGGGGSPAPRSTPTGSILPHE